MRTDRQFFAAHVGDLVQEAISFSQDFYDNTPVDPAPGSQADREMNHHNEEGPDGPWGRQPVEDAYNIASMLYGGAKQYLHALRQLLRDDIALFGFQAVTRAGLEAAARSWWILDPDRSVRERVERAYGERYYSLAELRKAAGAAGGELQRQVESESRLHIDVARLGLSERTDKSQPLGLAKGVGKGRPDSTDVVPELLASVDIDQGEFWYRTFSGIIHSALYAHAGYWRVVADPGSNGLRLAPQISPEPVGKAAVLLLSGYYAAIERHATLYGRDSGPLRAERLSVTGRITSALHLVKG